MLAPLLSLLLLGTPQGAEDEARAPVPLRLAGIGDSLPQLFLKLANRAIPGTIEATSTEFNAPSTVVLHGTRLMDAQGRVVAQVGRIKATLSISAILEGNIVVTDLQLERPKLFLAMQDGRLNLERALVTPGGKKDGDGSDMEIRLERVGVTDAELSYDDPGKATITATDIDGRGRVEVFVKTGLVFVTGEATSIDRGRVDLPNVEVPFRAMRLLAFRLRGQRLTLEGLKVTAAGAEVRGGGKVLLEGDGDLDLALQIGAPAGAWPGKLEPPPFPLPAVDANVKVTGAFASPQIDATGSFEPFAAYDYALGKGRFDVKVTPERVRIQSAQVALGSGTVSAVGTFLLDPKRLDLDASLDKVPLVRALAPAKLEPAPQGVMSGQATVKGIVDGKAPLDVTADVRLLSVKAFDLTPPTAMRLKSTLTVHPDRVKVGPTQLSGEGLSADVSGTLFLDEERVSLSARAEIADPGRIAPQVPKEVAVGTTRFTGTVTGPFARVRVEGPVTVARVDAYGVPLADVTTALVADSREVLARDITATVAGGALTGDVRVGLGRSGAITGLVAVRGGDLSALKVEGTEDLGVAGRFDLDAELSGPVKKPRVRAVLAADDVVAQGERVGEVRAEAWITPDDVRVSRLTVQGPVLAASTAGELVFGLSRDELSGRVLVHRVVLSELAALKEQQVVGVASGPLRLDGSLKQPKVAGPITLTGLGFSGMPLGDGVARIRLVPDERPGATKENLLLVAADLVGPRGRLHAQAGIALERQVVNAVVQLEGSDLEPWLVLAAQGEEPLPFEGTFDVDAEVAGPLKDPEVVARVFLPDLAIRRTSPTPLLDGAEHRLSNELRGYASRGAVRATATLKRDRLDAVVCAFPAGGRPDPYAPCSHAERVWVAAEGPLDPATGTFDLDVEAQVHDPGLEAFVPQLAEAGVRAAARLSAQLRLTKDAEDAPPVVEGGVQLDALQLYPTGAAPVVLTEPRFIRLDEGRIAMERPLVFRSGESDLTVAGEVNTARRTLALGVDGQLALSLVKPFTDELQSAGGEANASVSVTGSFDAPKVDGCVVPQTGAFVTPRALGRRVDLVSGQVCSRVSGGSEDPILVRADQLQIGLDDGRAALDGDLDLLVGSGSAKVTRWNLHSWGSSLVFRLSRGYVEGAYDVTLDMSGDDGHPRLAGRLEVNDGQARETFELKNFVVTKSATERRGRPLRETLALVGLDELELDLAVVLHNFDARANLATFRADGALRGELAVKSYAVTPLITGAIEVVDGQIQFPYATFEVEQTQVEFPPQKDGRINPQIFLLARGELEPPRNGLEIEVPAVLTLDGDLDKMALKLEAEATEHNFTEGSLMRFVLLGTPLSANAVVTDADAALRAVSSELTAAFSRDLEEAIQEQLGAQLTFNVFYEDGQLKGGVRYQLGERLEFDGEAGFLALGGGSGGAANAGSVTEARIRLLVLDHLPFWIGRELAFEGHATTGDGVSTQPSTNLRLSYRFFEY